MLYPFQTPVTPEDRLVAFILEGHFIGCRITALFIVSRNLTIIQVKCRHDQGTCSIPYIVQLLAITTISIYTI